MHDAVYWLNTFPAKNGIVKYVSPAVAMQGPLNANYNHLKILLGSYVQVH